MGLTVLDAGVLIAVLDGADVHHHAARHALAVARDRGDRLVVPASAYAEILVAPLRASSSAGAAVDELMDALPASAQPATRAIARRAAESRARHGGRMRLPDALVVATVMELHGDRVMTTDAGWPVLGHGRGRGCGIGLRALTASPSPADDCVDGVTGRG